MRVVIIYATNSGSTYFVSNLLRANLEKARFSVVLQTAENGNVSDIEMADVVLLGSPSWNNKHEEGCPHPAMVNFLNRLGNKKFPKKLFAIFGCGDSSYTYFCGAVDHLEKFVSKIGGSLILPALKIDGYYFDEVGNNRKVDDWFKKLINKSSFNFRS